MIHINGPELPWWALLPVIGYVTAPRTWVAGELVTASMMNTLRDLFLEIEAGTAEMLKVTLDGQTSAALASSLSASGQAAIAYNTTQGEIQMSVNGGAYESLGGGGFLPANAVGITMGLLS